MFNGNTYVVEKKVPTLFPFHEEGTGLKWRSTNFTDLTRRVW